MERRDALARPVEAYRHQGVDILNGMVADKDCTIILTIAGSTSAAGCMRTYADTVGHNMVDVIVATGATIVDMDFFEALGFRRYKGSPAADDKKLRSWYIDRIHDTYIDEEQLQVCDSTIKEIADGLEPRPYSSREFFREMGKYLMIDGRKNDSLVRDGACSGSTPKEASCWGKVDTTYEPMVFAEATSVLPLIAGYAYRKHLQDGRPQRRWSKIFEPVPAGERK